VRARQPARGFLVLPHSATADSKTTWLHPSTPNPPSRSAFGPICFPDLCQDGCSWLSTRGVPIHAVQQLAGHADLCMTHRYSHLTEQILVEAVRVLPALLGLPLSKTETNPTKSPQRSMPSSSSLFSAAWRKPSRPAHPKALQKTRGLEVISRPSSTRQDHSAFVNDGEKNPYFDGHHASMFRRAMSSPER